MTTHYYLKEKLIRYDKNNRCDKITYIRGVDVTELIEYVDQVTTDEFIIESLKKHNFIDVVE